MMTYKDLMDAHSSMGEFKSTERFAVLPNELYDTFYFSRRYDNIHRLITHCNFRPNRFKVFGVTYVRLEK